MARRTGPFELEESAVAQNVKWTDDDTESRPSPLTTMKILMLGYREEDQILSTTGTY